MANVQRGYVEVVLGGQKRLLHYDFEALCELQQVIGLGTFSELMQSLQNTGQIAIDMRFLRALLWAGLLDQNPGVTLRDVGKMVKPYQLPMVTEAVLNAITASLDVPPDATIGEVPEQGKSPPPDESSTGPT